MKSVALRNDDYFPADDSYSKGTPPQASAPEASPWHDLPAQPSTVPETGLPASLLDELVLKILRTHDRPRVIELADASALHPQVVVDVVESLVRRQQVEIQSADSSLILHFRYRLTDAGKAAADEALRRSSYVGPAPIPVESYGAFVVRQAGVRPRPTRRQVVEALSHLVMPAATIDDIGQAYLSGRTMMVFGPSGNGKTDIATSLAECTSGTVLIPSSLYSQGQIIEVFDPQLHHAATSARGGRREGPALEPIDRRDRRWREIRRPAIVVGGEIGTSALEMTFDPERNVHKAPLSVMAQGGVLVIDDLGRQRCPVETILDRWVQLMERGCDSFTLRYSEVVTLPMDVALIFSTNLSLEDLMDEAYLRRIPYKIQIASPGRQHLAEIARRACESAQLPFRDEAVHYLIQKLFSIDAIEPRGCYPRDIVNLIIDAAHYYGRTPELDPKSIDAACNLYFSYRQNARHRQAA